MCRYVQTKEISYYKYYEKKYLLSGKTSIPKLNF